MAIPPFKVVWILISKSETKSISSGRNIIPDDSAVKNWPVNQTDPWVGKIPWRRKWQPTPVFLPGKSHRWGDWRATPWSHKELDTTDRLNNNGKMEEILRWEIMRLIWSKQFGLMLEEKSVILKSWSHIRQIVEIIIIISEYLVTTYYVKNNRLGYKGDTDMNYIWSHKLFKWQMLYGAKDTLRVYAIFFLVEDTKMLQLNQMYFWWKKCLIFLLRFLLQSLKSINFRP